MSHRKNHRRVGNKFPLMATHWFPLLLINDLILPILGIGFHYITTLVPVTCLCCAHALEDLEPIGMIWAAARQNQQNDACAQERLRSGWASAQSDKGLRCPPEEALYPWLAIKRTANPLIRLGDCPGWSESSLGTHVLLLVLSCGCSFQTYSYMYCHRS